MDRGFAATFVKQANDYNDGRSVFLRWIARESRSVPWPLCPWSAQRCQKGASAMASIGNHSNGQIAHLAELIVIRMCQSKSSTAIATCLDDQ